MEEMNMSYLVVEFTLFVFTSIQLFILIYKLNKLENNVDRLTTNIEKLVGNFERVVCQFERITVTLEKEVPRNTELLEIIAKENGWLK